MGGAQVSTLPPQSLLSSGGLTDPRVQEAGTGSRRQVRRGPDFGLHPAGQRAQLMALGQRRAMGWIGFAVNGSVASV